MNRMHCVLCLGVWCLFAQNVHAQQVTIRVVDAASRKPVTDATVTVIATDSAAHTNVLGFCQVIAKSADSLRVSHDGYLPAVFAVPEKDKFQVSLVPEAETLPEYEGGDKAFGSHLAKTIRYPANARTNGRQGVVYAIFRIDSSGRMGEINFHEDVRGRNDSRTDYSREVVRVLRSLPGRWNPSAVGQTFILPVVFRIPQLTHPQFRQPTLPAGRVLSEITVSGYWTTGSTDH